MAKFKGEYWIVVTNNGVAYADKELGTAVFWNGGSNTFVPVFRVKKDAFKFARLARKSHTVDYARVEEAGFVYSKKPYYKKKWVE